MIFFRVCPDPRTKPDGSPLLVSIPMPARSMDASGGSGRRIPLFLRHQHPQNSTEDRWITGRLYGGDHDMRIRQEMILGIGGIALIALGKSRPFAT